jgi:hypothetical protein
MVLERIKEFFESVYQGILNEKNSLVIGIESIRYGKETRGGSPCHHETVKIRIASFIPAR